MNSKIQLQLRLDETAHAKTKVIADKEDRTLNSQFEYFIKRGIQQYERENGVVEVQP